MKRRLVLSLVLTSLALTLALPTLFLLDCGPHAQYTRSVLVREGYPAEQVLDVAVALTSPVECNNQSTLEEAFRALLQGNGSRAGDRINLSLGVFNYTGEWQSPALNRLLVERGVEVWAAAGNNASAEWCSWPASQEGVWAVTSADSAGALQPWSNGCQRLANRSRVLRVSGCSTSESTAIASARALHSDLIRSVDCGENVWQWPFMYGVLAVALAVWLVGAVLSVARWWRRRQQFSAGGSGVDEGNAHRLERGEHATPCPSTPGF